MIDKILKEKKAMKLIIVSILTVGALTGLWSYLCRETGIPEDSPPEEFVEEILGLDDLTPDTPEN